MAEDTDGITLDPNESTDETLTWTTSSSDEGEFVAEISGETDTEKTVVTVVDFTVLGTTVDNFEDAPDGPYDTGDDLSTYYSGDLNLVERTETEVIRGGYSLRATQPDVNAYQILSFSGLDVYPSKGDTFSCLGKLTDSGRHIMPMYGVESSDSYYQIFVSPASNSVRLRKSVNGSKTNLISKSVSISYDQLYDMEVDWGTDDSHTLTVWEASVTSGALSRDTEVFFETTTDNTFSGQSGVGFQWTGDSDGNGVTFYDEYRILD